MAGGIIIASAMAILLLVLAGYVLVGSSLASADSIASAQKDMTLQNEERLGTSIQISNAIISGSGANHILTFNIINTGSAIIGNFSNMDMFISISGVSGDAPFYYSYIGVPNTPGDSNSYTWGYTTISPDQIHPKMLDPGETMSARIENYNLVFPHPTIYIIVTTPNGISVTGNT